VILGVIIHKFEEKPPLSEVWFNATMLAVAGLVLLLADKGSKQRRDIETVSLKDTLIIGAAQALALIPGVSRSGSTLTAGLMLGFKRSDAMRFSFLMSLPISVGAIVFELPKMSRSNDSAVAIILGILVSAASGFWAIGFLLNYLKTKDVTPFFIWRVAVAVLVFALLSAR
jgi:undecaprenyl-diphosphatase